ncbi:MAG TPA: sensor histidine kinase N-terminal domain-containing protein, partial [Ideonella sp.]|nr:sensor histidine kinase N-terminal domain-containing protein [Ideonella sp.]
MSQAPRRLPSLRARMARHVLLPLAAVWLAATAIVLTIASHSTEAAFDRALLDDALGLAASVSLQEGRLQIDLSAEELDAVLFDQSEVVYFAMRAADGTLIAGQPALRAEPPAPGRAVRQVEFTEIDFRHEILRGVVLQREHPAPFSVVLAQTTQGRSAHWQRLLLYSLTPLIGLLLLLGWWLGRAIEHDLHPVAELQDELNRRQGSELQPLAVPATTSDLESLVRSVNGLMGRLSTLVAAQREFSGTVAHELRTPLAGIRALAAYGLAHDDPALWREQLAAIVQSQERASRLVDQLLALALADEARSAPALVPVALDELVRRVLLRTLPRADALGVDLGAQGIDDEVM